MRKKNLKGAVSVLVLLMSFSMAGCSINEQQTSEASSSTVQSQNEQQVSAQQEKDVSKEDSSDTEAESEASGTEEYITYYVVNCEDSIDLYQKPDVKSENLFQMPLGTPVTFVESAENGFYKVIYDGNTGYALASYLSKEKPQVEQKPSETPAATITPVSYVTYYVVNCNESITLRPDANVASGEICQIPLGAAVSYIEPGANGFYKVVYNGNTGYALASYLSTEKPAIAHTPVLNQEYSYTTYYVVNCKQSITLRPKPDVGSGEICQIPLGSAVSFLDTAANGFYKIIYNGNTGYALASYLSTQKGSVNTVANSYSSSYDTYYVSYCDKSITLRNSPDVYAGEICQIPLGSAVGVVCAADNGFYYVQYDGQYGYALASYLSAASGASIYSICEVVNCKQSITLRPAADVYSGEVRQIPLGETVTYIGNAGNGFYEIYYMGDHGYALADYLTFVS